MSYKGSRSKNGMRVIINMEVDQKVKGLQKVSDIFIQHYVTMREHGQERPICSIVM